MSYDSSSTTSSLTDTDTYTTLSDISVSSNILSNINSNNCFEKTKQLNTFFIDYFTQNNFSSNNIKVLNDFLCSAKDMYQLLNTLNSENKTIKIEIDGLEGIMTFENEVSASKYILKEIIKNIELCLCDKNTPQTDDESKKNSTIEILPCDDKSKTLGGTKKKKRRKSNKKSKSSGFALW